MIGLLMLRSEDDILGSVLNYNAPLVDAFYVLDGTVPNTKSRPLCERWLSCRGYWTDDELPERYGTVPRDGWREWLYRNAVIDFGYDNWFVLMHGDEVWTISPAQAAAEHPDADGLVFHLPVYFPREEWDETAHPLDQLRWSLGPGWPELRMFRGGERVGYDVTQHFNVTPRGIGRIADTRHAIKHYPFRSPTQQRARAAQHAESGFDPDNYRHILDRDEVVWSDAMIARWQRQRCWRDLRCE